MNVMEIASRRRILGTQHDTTRLDIQHGNKRHEDKQIEWTDRPCSGRIFFFLWTLCLQTSRPTKKPTTSILFANSSAFCWFIFTQRTNAIILHPSAVELLSPSHSLGQPIRFFLLSAPVGHFFFVFLSHNYRRLLQSSLF